MAAEHGQSIVEFVLVVPFLLVLLFGIVDFGIAINHSSDLNQVAAATARRLAVNSDPAFDPKAYLKSIAEPGVRNNSTLVITICLPGGTTPGTNAAVSVEATMDRTVTIVPGFPAAGPTLHLDGRATNRLETPATFTGVGSASTTQAPCDS